MASYKTPDVYVEEISTLPPSVAEVSTAIPVFIGFTDKAGKDNRLRGVPTRINTYLDYRNLFGDPQPAKFDVTVTEGAVSNVAVSTAPDYLLAHAVDMFYRNGGGTCYIMSIGGYDGNLPQGQTLAQAYLAAIDTIGKEDEPTLFVLSDAVSTGADYFGIVDYALQQCNRLKDRFVLVDVEQGMSASDFRDDLTNNNLKFGAAYTPYLETTLTHSYVEADVKILGTLGNAVYNADLTLNGGIKVSNSAPLGPNGRATYVRVNATELTTGAGISFALVETTSAQGVPEFEMKIGGVTSSGKTAQEIMDAWNATAAASAKAALTDKGFTLTLVSGTATVTSTTNRQLLAAQPQPTVSMASLASGQTALYNQVKAALAQQRVTLPPSPAIAGIYASVDRDRGVWKAPANVSVSAVIAPVEKISSADQEDLNVDATSGKSINAIRTFAGKGTLVWGARTLAGNDNEWRYISVRRLFNLIEESTRKATAFAVFEPNDASTWLKVKAMIDTYLYGLWERGALVGGAPDKAYFVNVGLGKTMTPQDILNGYMNIEIGVAAVRPAEFIVLKFSHKLQEA